MSLTIIGGKFKGRSLFSPPGPLTKPTLALLRKSVFDICQGYLEGARFLDLFACSGAMGLEAISRGAALATFVEKDRKTCSILKKNIELLGVQNQTTVLCMDAFAFPNIKQEAPYDIVYIDPPYPLSKAPHTPVLSLIQALDSSAHLASSCLLFVEEESPGSLPLQQTPFTKLVYKNNRSFGSSFLHQMRID